MLYVSFGVKKKIQENNSVAGEKMPAVFSSISVGGAEAGMVDCSNAVTGRELLMNLST